MLRKRNSAFLHCEKDFKILIFQHQIHPRMLCICISIRKYGLKMHQLCDLAEIAVVNDQEEHLTCVHGLLNGNESHRQRVLDVDELHVYEHIS